MGTYAHIQPSGSDTGATINVDRRLKIMAKYLLLNSSKILDCGCGAGQYVYALSNRGCDVAGIEINEQKVATFKQKYPVIAHRVSVGNAQSIGGRDSVYDAVLLNEVLEHVPNEHEALSEIHRVLKPRGRLVVFSPNRFYPFETHGVHIAGTGRKVPFYVPFVPYVPLWLGGHLFDYHARNYWPFEMRRLIKVHGFSIIHAGYLWQTFENISGRQPALITMFASLLRQVSFLFERIPLLRIFGVSQVIIAEKIPVHRHVP